MKKYFDLKNFLKNLFVILVTVELFSVIAIKFFQYTQLWYKYPTYLNWQKTVVETYDPLGVQFIDTTVHTWSTWHKPNTSFRHKMDCFDALIKYNDLGGRGSLPKFDNKNNVIFLGDSFIHGFGLNETETIPYQYSKLTHNPNLNLGGAGLFGSTQMRLIYENFAPKFKHKAVVICQYLENDFVDDDINQFYPQRYRPYLVPTANNEYQLQYKEDITQSVAKTSAYDSKTKALKVYKQYSIQDFFSLEDKNMMEKIAAFFYTPRLFTEIYYRVSQKNQKPLEIEGKPYHTKLMRYNIQKIIDTAKQNGAQVYILNIPSKYFLMKLPLNPNYLLDLTKLKNEYLNGLATNKLDFETEVISNKNAIADLFFKCDSHFNKDGAAFTAKFIAKKIP